MENKEEKLSVIKPVKVKEVKKELREVQKVKVLSIPTAKRLEDEVNAFISNSDVTVIDIKLTRRKSEIAVMIHYSIME